MRPAARSWCARGREPEAILHLGGVMAAKKKSQSKRSLARRAPTSELTVAAPKSIWTRPIKLSLGGFFTALGKLVVDVGTSQWAEASKDAVDVVAAFGLAREPQELAGVLISRALMRAVNELIDPYRGEFPAVLFPGPIDFGEELDRRLAELTIVLDERFLEQPRDLEIVRQFRGLVEEWLGHVDLEGHSPATIAARLPARFVYALHRECIEHRGEYARLFDELNSEFRAAWQRERSWDEYRHWFESELAARVFVEDFGLEQIFQWPRAYFVDHQWRRSVVRLREELDRWLSTRSREDCIRVISGEPGAGKSSFTRMYAAHRMALGDRVLMIPLHTLNVAHDLIEAITALCRNTPPYPNTPFETGDTPLLLILDGLDELSKQGLGGSRLASDFARHVQQAVTTRNLGASIRLQVLLSGRPIAVQDVSESEFRATGQVLHLVAYAVGKQADRNASWRDPENLLSVDQRHAWWKRYGELTQTDFQGLPEALTSASLFETTVQPLLGYLLALAHRDAFGKGQTIDRDVSRNEIYGQLIQAVFKRDYNKPTRGHIASRGLTGEQFETLLEELALAAWHEDTRVVRVAAVERICTKSGRKQLLDNYIEASQTGVAQLFTAFYFRRSGTRASGDESFEFTHKSFAEYLVARRMVAELANAAEDLAERDASQGRRTRGKDEPALLLDWLEVFGPSGITQDLLGYLVTEVRLRAETQDVGRWQDTLVRLINCVLREGMPCERLTGVSFNEMRRRAGNAEMALLVMLYCCTGVTDRLAEVDWPDATSFKDWLRQLRAMDHAVPLLFHRLSVVGQNVAKYNLSNFKFSKAVLRATILRGANLSGATLAGADLINANLRTADLSSAILQDANLQFADLTSARLTHTNLRDANLQGVDFSNANLEHALLQSADLCSADLRGADLQNCNMQNANLRGANLRGANLHCADLRGADLLEADLQDVDLLSTKISAEQLAGARGTPKRGPV